MSLQDDVFDVQSVVKHGTYEKAFNRIVNRLWETQQELADVKDKLATLKKAVKVVGEAL